MPENPGVIKPGLHLQALCPLITHIQPLIPLVHSDGCVSRKASSNTLKITHNLTTHKSHPLQLGLSAVN